MFILSAAKDLRCIVAVSGDPSLRSG